MLTTTATGSPFNCDASVRLGDIMNTNNNNLHINTVTPVIKEDPSFPFYLRGWVCTSSTKKLFAYKSLLKPAPPMVSPIDTVTPCGRTCCQSVCITEKKSRSRMRRHGNKPKRPRNINVLCNPGHHSKFMTHDCDVLYVVTDEEASHIEEHVRAS